MTGTERAGQDFDWTEKCPFCAAEFFGYHNSRTVEENPYCALLDHVPKEHPEQMVTCSSDARVAFWRSDDTCSNCGGLKPERVFEAIEVGHEVGPTDKNYKIYLGPHNQKAYFYHFSDSDKVRFIDLYNVGKMKIGYPGYFYARPYFMKFIERKNP